MDIKELTQEIEAQAYQMLHGVIDDLLDEPNMAEFVLRELDARMHPWGEVGDVPVEDGEYYVVHGDEQEVHTAYIETAPEGRMVTLDNWDECLSDGEGLVCEHRFRKRWTPAPPNERVLEAARVVGQSADD